MYVGFFVCLFSSMCTATLSSVRANVRAWSLFQKSDVPDASAVHFLARMHEALWLTQHLQRDCLVVFQLAEDDVNVIWHMLW